MTWFKQGHIGNGGLGHRLDAFLPLLLICMDARNRPLTATVRYGLVVRIPGSHPGGPGSIPGNGNLFRLCYCHLRTE